LTETVNATLLTGFLGAGKTTLLNHLLRNSGARRIGVLVNDFGALPVDGLLVESVDEDTIAFAGGCMCCQIRDDVPRAVARLLARSEQIDHLVVEASGVANPFEAAKPLIALGPAIGLNGVIGVIDAERLVSIEHPDGEIDWADLVVDHVMAADIVVLNKVDLLTERELERARELARGAVTQARLLEAVQARVPVELLLGPGPRTRTVSSGTGGHARHDFDSWSFQSEAPFDLERFRRAVGSLPATVVRGKGRIQITNDGTVTPVLFQLVGTRVEIAAWTGDRGGSHTKLVLIATTGALDVTELQARFEDCTVCVP
jgi:G3E family GTPase